MTPRILKRRLDAVIEQSWQPAVGAGLVILLEGIDRLHGVKRLFDSIGEILEQVEVSLIVTDGSTAGASAAKRACLRSLTPAIEQKKFVQYGQFDEVDGAALALLMWQSYREWVLFLEEKKRAGTEDEKDPQKEDSRAGCTGYRNANYPRRATEPLVHWSQRSVYRLEVLTKVAVDRFAEIGQEAFTSISLAQCLADMSARLYGTPWLDYSNAADWNEIDEDAEVGEEELFEW